MLNGVYGGTKSFVLAFSHSLRKVLQGTGVNVQVVLPGATGTEFWDVAGLPASHLPTEWVMSADDLVDAALVGLDRGEFATIPSLQDASEWDAWEAARGAMLRISPAASRLIATWPEPNMPKGGVVITPAVLLARHAFTSTTMRP